MIARKTGKNAGGGVGVVLGHELVCVGGGGGGGG